VLNALAHFAAGGGRSPLPVALDTRHVGIMGYSFGGAIAAQACMHDPRFIAALNLDGWLAGDAKTLGFRQPFLFITDGVDDLPIAEFNSSDPARHYPAMLAARDNVTIRQRMRKPDAYLLVLPGTPHDRFADMGLPPRSLRAFLSDVVARPTLFPIVSSFVGVFFDRTLKGATTPMPIPPTTPPHAWFAAGPTGIR
jgi:dienelactone hydrolase